MTTSVVPQADKIAKVGIRIYAFLFFPNNLESISNLRKKIAGMLEGLWRFQFGRIFAKGGLQKMFPGHHPPCVTGPAGCRHHIYVSATVGNRTRLLDVLIFYPSYVIIITS